MEFMQSNKNLNPCSNYDILRDTRRVEYEMVL